MNRNIAVFLLLSAVFTGLYGQIGTRYYPNQLAPHNYEEALFAPIVPTADGGYLYNVGFGNGGWRSGWYQGELFKLDSSFVPEWRLHIGTHSGVRCFENPDHSITLFGGATFGNFMTQLQSDGHFSWSKRIDRPVELLCDILHVFERGDHYIASGVTYSYDAFGYYVYQTPVQLTVDSIGNVLHVDSLSASGRIWTDLSAVDEDSEGGTWMVGETYELPSAHKKYVMRLDSNHTVTAAFDIDGVAALFSKQYWHKVKALSNGDVLLIGAGEVGNSILDIYQPTLARITPSGTVLWAQRLEGAHLPSNVSELPDGDLLFTGTLFDSIDVVESAIMARFTSAGSLLWARQSVVADGIGEPWIGGANNWVFPVLGNCPILVGTDSLGMNSQCPTLNLTLTPVPISISLSPMQMQVFPHTMHTVPGDSAILQPHAHIDSCQVVPVGLQPQSAMEVEVFPNPTSGRVSLNATQAIIRILVIDPLGREVASSHPGSAVATMEIPANGPHWLKIELEDGSVLTRKVVKL